MKIAIAGAGAMGSRFGYMLKKSGQDVILIDGWQEHLDIIKSKGLTIDNDQSSEILPFTAYSTTEIKNIKDSVDIIILFVKAMQLPNMLNDLKDMIHENTKVICLLNGLGHIETIEKYLPKRNIFVGVTLWSASLIGPGHIHLSGSGSIELQNIDPTEQAAAQKIVDIFNQAKLNASYSANVLSSIWRKACANGAANAICAILDCNLSQLSNSPKSHQFVNQVISEFITAAKAINNVELDQDTMVDFVESTFQPEKLGAHYPSMHQDLIQNHRLTEIDYLNGYVAQKAKDYSFSAPYCELITFIVHAKEDILGIK